MWGELIGGCESKKVPLNKEQFTNLLIDLHKVDGTLSVYRGIGQGYNELKNYEYYNDVFRKYHIDKAGIRFLFILLFGSDGPVFEDV